MKSKSSEVKIRDTKGFTLIELMVMLSIVLILATLAIPNYYSSIARSEQAEAKSNLAEIYVKIMSFEPSTALSGFSEIVLLSDVGFNPPENAYYEYSVTATTNSFTARAEGVSGQVIGDKWRVSEAQKMPFDVEPTRFDE